MRTSIQISIEIIYESTFRAEKHGFAIQLEFNKLDLQTLLNALRFALTDEVLKERLEVASNLFTDRKDGGADTAIWWLNYVIRHNGCQFLKPYSTHLNFVQYLGMDICLLLFIAFFSFVKILFAFYQTYNMYNNGGKELGMSS